MNQSNQGLDALENSSSGLSTDCQFESQGPKFHDHVQFPQLCVSSHMLLCIDAGGIEHSVHLIWIDNWLDSKIVK